MNFKRSLFLVALCAAVMLPSAACKFNFNVEEKPKGGRFILSPEYKQPPGDAVTTTTGLKYKTIQPGTGKESPTVYDVVKVKFVGWDSNGKVIDNSPEDNMPEGIAMDSSIPGWSEGLSTMVVGERRMLWVPESLAYEKKPGAPAGALIFDVELFKIIKMPIFPYKGETPPDDAIKTDSGLRYKIIEKGKGTAKPTKDSKVVLHFMVWTPDGKMTDSSYMDERAEVMDVSKMIPGMAEGVQEMVEGDTALMWVPDHLSLKNKWNGKSVGPLILQVKIQAIKI